MGFVTWGKNQTRTEKDRNKPPRFPPPRTGSFVASASPGYSTRVNRGTHQPWVATRVDGAEPRLVQNAVSINCGG